MTFDVTPTMRNLPRAQRGAVALVITLLLFLAMALAALSLRRSLTIEQRHASAQVRATQAFEAAEAGLAWMQARLNQPKAIDAACQPSAASAEASFRFRTLSLDPESGAIGVRRVGGFATAACVRASGGWSCACAAGGTPALAVSGSGALVPAFSVSLQAGNLPGQIRVAAQGCSGAASPCVSGTTTNAATPAAETATTSATLALFAGLRTPPRADLTTRDGALQTEAEFFASFFGVDKPTWRNQSVVAQLACADDCGSALTQATSAGYELIAIEGSAQLHGPLALGTKAHPVAIVANGNLRLDGPVAIVGAVYAASIMVGAPGLALQGALITEGGYAGPAELVIRFDAGVLEALRHQTGSFVRVGGGWRDF